ATGQVLELVQGELAGVDRDSALGAAVGDPDRGALPGHEHRERLDQVEVDVRVVADAAFGRAAADVVLDAPAGVDADRAVVVLDREMHRELALDLAQAPPGVVGEADHVGSGVETALCGLESGSPGVDRHLKASDSNAARFHNFTQCRPEALPACSLSLWSRWPRASFSRTRSAPSC